MTFGTDVLRYCISSISTPFAAHAYVTSTYPIYISGTSTFNYSTVHEYVTSTLIGSVSGRAAYSTFTVSSITTITSALAVADPLVVAWQVNDLKSFPNAYATSLANKIGVSPPASASPSARVQDVPGLPSETAGGTAPTTPGLSTAAKAGIGVGCAIGALFIAAIVALLWFKKRRKAASAAREETPIPEMEDQDAKLGKKKWFLGGNWRSEAEAEAETQELDGKTVHVVAGPPAELEAHEAQDGLIHTQASER
jgi:hypothetical protein